KANGAPVFGPGQYAAVQEVLQQQNPRSVCYCALACEQPQKAQGVAGARGAEQLVGAAVGLQEKSCIEVVSCVVRADWRGQGGIGRRLVGALLSHPGHQEEPDNKDEDEEGEHQGMEGPRSQMPPAPAPLRAESRSSAAGHPQEPSPPSAASTGAGNTRGHAQCWVPPAHPFHNLLCKHMGFEPSPHPPNMHTGSTPGFALPGSQLLVKAAVPSPREGWEEMPTSDSGQETRSEKAVQPTLQQPGPAVNSLAVRTVGFQDMEAVVALHRDAEYQGKPVFGGQGLPAVQAVLELASRGSSDIIVLVAETHDGQILGACTGELELESAGPAGTSPVLALLTLVVCEQAQRRGVGAMLLRAVVEEGKARGAACVETDVATINQPAIQMFSKEGFTFKSKPDSSAAARGHNSSDHASSVHATSKKGGGFGGGAAITKASKKGGRKVRAPSGKGGAQPCAPASIEMVLDLQQPASDQAQSSAPPVPVGTSARAQRQDGPEYGVGNTSSSASFITTAAHSGRRDGSICISMGATAAGPLTSVCIPRCRQLSTTNRMHCPSRSTTMPFAPLRLI
ncbi:acyl-CoA N-acyltransferase, partial [Dunaliella salina]